MEPNGVNSSTNLNQKGDHVAVDLETTMDTQRLLSEGKNQGYVNKLCAREMASLRVLSDTFLPAIDPPDPNLDDSVAQFYRTSASMAGTPEYLGGLISQRLQHHVLLARFLLICLSTSIGTFILGGFRTLSPRFPFFQTFSQLSPSTRQQMLFSWSTSYIYLFRMAFLGLKILVVYAFFTQVDEKEHNLSWKAIGYDGSDPEFKSKTKFRKHNFSDLQLGCLTPSETPTQDEPNKPNNDTNEDLYGPLHKGVINAKHPHTILAESLRCSGFHVSLKDKSKKQVVSSSSSPPTMTIQCDAVVVGSGSGGGVVAGVLASSGYKVLVLEKGDYFARSNLSLLEGPTLDQMYEGAGLISTRDVRVSILAGSTVGGGSSINWSASIRTPPHVVREWARVYELEMFESPLYEKALDTICERMGVQSGIDNEGFNNEVLRKGCLELGYPVEDIPRNAPRDHYCGWCSLGCKDGKKKGTSETWLKDLVDSSNGVILSGCEVIEILHSRKKGRNRNSALGVTFKLNGELCRVEAKATIIACGALSTPPLLKKSGLKNPSIGKNLHLHPVTMAWGYFPEDNNKDYYEGKKSYTGGIMTSMSTVVGNFEKSGYGAIIQTPSLHPGLFSVTIPWKSGIDFKHRMSRFSRTAHIFALARDVGSGEVHNSPCDITYDLNTFDEENLKQGIEKMLRILAAAGATEIGTHHFGGESINVKEVSYHEFEKFVKIESSKSISKLSATIASAHQMGSCRMGVDPKTSVVNQWGETWEVEGLYLADTSVFPTALGVNPMVTVQAISYCTAQSVLQFLARKRKR